MKAWLRRKGWKFLALPLGPYKVRISWHWWRLAGVELWVYPAEGDAYAYYMKRMR